MIVRAKLVQILLTMAIQSTNFRVNYEDFNFVEMVYGTGSQILCKRMAKLATQLLNSIRFSSRRLAGWVELRLVRLG